MDKSNLSKKELELLEYLNRRTSVSNRYIHLNLGWGNSGWVSCFMFLGNLERKGLVESREILYKNGKPKEYLYSITEQGKEFIKDK